MLLSHKSCNHQTRHSSKANDNLLPSTDFSADSNRLPSFTDNFQLILCRNLPPEKKEGSLQPEINICLRIFSLSEQIFIQLLFDILRYLPCNRANCCICPDGYAPDCFLEILSGITWFLWLWCCSWCLKIHPFQTGFPDGLTIYVRSHGWYDRTDLPITWPSTGSYDYLRYLWHWSLGHWK